MATKIDSHIRPKQNHRKDYQPMWPQETFIVPLLREKIDEMLGIFCDNPAPGARVLDVGCGRQPLRDQLIALNYSYVGLDVQQNTDESVDILSAIDQPLSGSAAAVGGFELIICTEVLEHVADWSTAFSNLALLLCKGGKLIITCPHFYQLHEEPYDYWRATPHALGYYADKANLEILHQEVAGDAWDVLGTLLANCHSLPATMSLSNRISNKMVSMGRSWLFNSLKERSLQKKVQLRSPLFLSNIIVLTRQ